MWFLYVVVGLVLYQLGTTTVIVTAGIGMSVVPIRYAAPGSVELIDLWLPHEPSACRAASAAAPH